MTLFSFIFYSKHPLALAGVGVEAMNLSNLYAKESNSSATINGLTAYIIAAA